jgi:hypothetical protein
MYRRNIGGFESAFSNPARDSGAEEATKLANGGEREDVGQRVGIVPDSPKILDVTDKRRNLGAAIGEDL